MKKFFTLFASTLLSVGAMAQGTVTYTFGPDASQYKLGENCEATSYIMEGADNFSVNYTGTEKAKMTVSLVANPNVVFEYSNSTTKDNVIKTGIDYINFDAKNVVLVVSNLKEGDEVSIVYTAKGSTDSQMTNAENENTIVVDGSVATTNKDNKVTYTVKAAANGSVKIKETAGGYRLYSLTVPGSSSEGAPSPEPQPEVNAISTVTVGAAQNGKVLENGEMLIIKNGVKYTLTGVRK